MDIPCNNVNNQKSHYIYKKSEGKDGFLKAGMVAIIEAVSGIRKNFEKCRLFQILVADIFPGRV